MGDDLRELAAVLRKNSERAVGFDQFQTADALDAVADAITGMLDDKANRLRMVAKRKE